MSFGLVITIAFVMFLGFLWESRQRYARSRERLTATMKRLAVAGRSEIAGQPVEHWLNVLNQDSPQDLFAVDSAVFIYHGQELFFVNGTIGGPAAQNRCVYRVRRLCFLVAVGRPAVTLLSQQGQVLRLVSGSAELAAFSIFRLSDFAALIRKERSGRRGRGDAGGAEPPLGGTNQTA
jgi:hypothetical protein